MVRCYLVFKKWRDHYQMLVDVITYFAYYETMHRETQKSKDYIYLFYFKVNEKTYFVIKTSISNLVHTAHF